MKNEECLFCANSDKWKGKVIFRNRFCTYLELNHDVLKGSGLIIPRKHRATVFDLTIFEWISTYFFLRKVKRYIDMKYKPDGYNIGWNVNEIGGQEIFHAHLHVIPRYSDEPYAGKGIRYWLKQKDNTRK